MREESRLRTLIALIKLGVSQTSIVVSTSDLGRVLGLSQQAASWRLLELESEGMIERRRAGRKVGLKMTDKGHSFVASVYAELKGAIEQRLELIFNGRVFTGMREGGYYVNLGGYRKQFAMNLGFDPYPGTLNLRLSSPLEIAQKRQLRSMVGIPIHGFEDKARTYGPAKCFRASINRVHQGAALVIERTHYDDTVLELISPLNLRKELDLKDGDDVSVTVQLGA